MSVSTSSGDILFSGTVLKGNQLGRTIGFPTINLDPSIFPKDKQPGVYATLVRFPHSSLHSNQSNPDQNKQFLGALYFGPRLVKNETQNVLEIFILDFSSEVYEAVVEVSLGEFVRPPKHFESLSALQNQIENDCTTIRKIYS